MPNFPFLKTGAAAQYPYSHSTQFSTSTIRFLDGAQQRFPNRSTARKQWTFPLEKLDEAERSAIVKFVASVDGPHINFAFEDPLTLETHLNCVYASEAFSLVEEAETIHKTVIRLATED